MYILKLQTRRLLWFHKGKLILPLTLVSGWEIKIIQKWSNFIWIIHSLVNRKIIEWYFCMLNFVTFRIFSELDLLKQLRWKMEHFNWFFFIWKISSQSMKGWIFGLIRIHLWWEGGVFRRETHMETKVIKQETAATDRVANLLNGHYNF